MELIAFFSTAFVVGLSGAMMPGPMLTMTITETTRQGFWAGPRIVTGHALIELLLVIGLLFGLSQLLQLPVVTGVIGLLGGCMLMYMGWGIGKDAILKRVTFNVSAGGGEAVNTASGANSFSPIIAGVVLSISNPYWILWWATVGLGYMVAAMNYGLAGVAAFYIGHILSDFAWFSLVSAIVHTGRNWISGRLYQGILTICAVFLVGLGLIFSYDGWKVLSQ